MRDVVPIVVAVVSCASPGCGSTPAAVVTAAAARPARPAPELPDPSIAHRFPDERVMRGVIVEGEDGSWLAVPGQDAVLALAPVPAVPPDAACGEPDSDAALWVFPGKHAYALELDTEMTYWAYLPSRGCMVGWPASARPQGDEVSTLEVSWDGSTAADDGSTVPGPHDSADIDLDGDGVREHVELDLDGLHLARVASERDEAVDLGGLPNGFDGASWDEGRIAVAFERGASAAVLVHVTVEASTIPADAQSEPSELDEEIVARLADYEMQILFHEWRIQSMTVDACAGRSGSEVVSREIVWPLIGAVLQGQTTLSRQTQQRSRDPSCEDPDDPAADHCTGQRTDEIGDWQWQISGETQYLELAIDSRERHDDPCEQDEIEAAQP